MSTYVQATIGGNIGDAYMGDEKFKKFTEEVYSALHLNCEGVQGSTVMKGQGHWEGVSEPSAMVSAVCESADIEQVKIALSGLCARYEQDAIALVVDSELIGTSLWASLVSS